MRRFVLALALLIPVVGVGCHHNLRSNGCASCGGGCGGGDCGDACGGGGHRGRLGGGMLGGRRGRDSGCRECGVTDGRGRLGGGGLLAGLGGGAPQHVSRMSHGDYFQGMAGPPGPPTATYAYPYYTTRAPRDFLLDNPPTIGR